MGLLIFANQSRSMKKSFLLIVCGLAFCSGSSAQGGQEGEWGLLAGIDYGYQLPGGDLADRFGGGFKLGGRIDAARFPANWSLGLEGGFIFGNQVKEDVLAAVRTEDGGIIGNDRSFADIQLRQRAVFLGLAGSKVFPLGDKDRRSGLVLRLGGGLLQHRIRIQEDPARRAPVIEGVYQKGFDRLSNGPYLHQFVGYQYLSADRGINFYVGVEAYQAFTQSRRSFDLASREIPAGERFDQIWAFKVGWILPFYFGEGSDIFY